MARHNRVSEALRREIGSIIHDELNDPRRGFITITRVELTQDLRYAKVFFSVLGTEQERQKSKEALESGLGFIRRLIAQRIRLRFVPEISFYEDRSAEYSIRIQEALDEIKELNEPRLSSTEVIGANRKEVRGEPKKSRRLHKKA